MNIFYLHKQPGMAAGMQCDKHVVKMTLESTQLLCTVRRKAGENNPILYRAAYENHPCVVWAETSRQNYLWLCKHAINLAFEYRHRYSKTHKCLPIIQYCFTDNLLFDEEEFYDPPQCMPTEFHCENTVEAYRKYYVFKSQVIKPFRYTNREVPTWLNEQSIT